MREHLLVEIDPWLPAIMLVGEERPVTASGVEPPWRLHVEHQYGGVACRQAELAGIVIPLAGVPSAGPLMKGLDALGCDGPYQPEIREHEHVAPLHLTTGRAYDAVQIDCLRAFFAQAPDFPLPRVRFGHEALVELDASPDDLRKLVGLPVLGPELPPGAALTDAHVELDVGGPLGVYEGAMLTTELLERLGPLEGVCALLLWANSD